MSDNSHIERLLGGVDGWNYFVSEQRHRDPAWVASLDGAELNGAHLVGADLSGANLVGAHLVGANLRQARLSRANMVDAKLGGADLVEAVLIGADLSYAVLKGAVLNGANLSGADLRRASLTGADLRRANLSRANLSGAALSTALLTAANLSAATLIDANFRLATMIAAVLTDAILIDAHLDDANLNASNLDGAILVDATLVGATLVDASLVRASLVGAVLDRAVLNRAVLDGANLDRAKLLRAELDGAIVGGAARTGGWIMQWVARRATEVPVGPSTRSALARVRISFDFPPNAPYDEVLAVAGAIRALCDLAVRVGGRAGLESLGSSSSVSVLTTAESRALVVSSMHYGSPWWIELIELVKPLVGPGVGAGLLAAVASDMRRGVDGSVLINMILTLCRPVERQAYLDARKLRRQVEVAKLQDELTSARGVDLPVVVRAGSSADEVRALISDQPDDVQRAIQDHLDDLAPVLSRKMTVTIHLGELPSRTDDPDADD